MGALGEQWFAAPAAYTIDNSCIYNGTDDAMSRTPGSAGNRKIWTFSTWIKRTKTSSALAQLIFMAGVANDRTFIDFTTDDTLEVGTRVSGTFTYWRKTTQVFRDYSAWYHIVVSLNTTDGTAGDRVKVYVNGSQVSNFGTTNNPAEDFEGDIGDTDAHYIGSYINSSNYVNAYLADTYLIDGSVKTPSDFGETNAEGVWVPKLYGGGSYGTTGFYLDYADSSDLGDDNSGQGNDWTEANIAAANQSKDTPSNNHCIWNAAYPMQSTVTLTEGNTLMTNSAGSQDKAIANFFMNSGKWYWEVKCTSFGGHGMVGMSQNDVGSNEELGNNNSSGTGIHFGYRSYDGKTYKNSTLSTFGDTWGVNDIIGVAWDADNSKVYLAKNNTWQNSGDPTSGATGTGAAYTLSSTIVDGGGWAPAVCNESSTIFQGRFPESSWEYDPPSGFSSLCTDNMPEPAIKDGSKNFQMDDYAGNGSTQSRTFGGNSDMKPDILWIKAKNTTTGWIEHNGAVGVQKYAMLNNQDTEASDSNALTAFNSDGYSIGTFAAINSGTHTFFSAGWSAGGSGSSNTDGGINTTTTFVDQTAGISVGTYTGTGSGATVGHGLGATPAVVFIFPRSNGDHKVITNWEAGVSVYSEKLKLNDNGVPESSSGFVTAASSTTFTLGTDVNVNGADRTYFYYAFAEVEGFSRFGTYTGTGDTDGQFIYTGFRPAMFISKCDRDGESWIMFNSKTDPINQLINYAYPSEEDAFTTNSNFVLDFLSNGVKPRGSESRINRSGNKIIYMAIAENHFGGDGIAPATAR